MCGVPIGQTAGSTPAPLGCEPEDTQGNSEPSKLCSAENPSAIPPTSAQLEGAGSRDGASVWPEGVRKALLTPNIICINGLCHSGINTGHEALNSHN